MPRLELLNYEVRRPLTRVAFCLHNGTMTLLRFRIIDRPADFQQSTDPFRAPYPARQVVGQTEIIRMAKNDDDRRDSRQDTGTITRTKPKTKKPSLYRVMLLNDDYTPMEFVVLILQDVFNKTREEAVAVMMQVHNKGVGECGTFPYEVAETKVARVMETARKNQHPLQCVMEQQ
ncbi:MAG: clpS [Devosia sp.]|nr:clpS [Devosia sp.]